MESSYFYQWRRQQQRGSLSSLAAPSIPGVAAIHEANPSLHPYNIDEYISLPITTEALRNANLPDKGSYDEYISIQSIAVDPNQNLCPTWASDPNPSLTDTCHVFNDTIAAINASSSWGLLPPASSALTATNFFHNNGEDRSPNEDSSLSSYGSNIRQSTNSNQICSRTKRLISSTSSERRQPEDEAVKKQKALTQASCSSPKVGKEKIGDKIAGLHRLVAPFGKTDAASVLTEAIGYIQFLQHQIQTLSMPCIKPSQRDRRTFEWVSSKKDEKQDLRSRGLCLVPSSIASYISSSCTGLDLDAV